MPHLLFHGAAGEVTGSLHMIRCNGRWIALECGLVQGKREDSERKNREWPLTIDQVEAVVLSHAHIDHSGRLPRLVKDGYQGPIYCTPATRDLCALMLPDSAHIQEEDVFYVNKKRKRQGLEPIEALYEYNDALAAVHLIQTIDYDRWFDVIPGVRARYIEAGHMLGSAGVLLELTENGRTTRLYFTGDLGRPNKPIIRDPHPLPEADLVLCESTYGGRIHESTDDAQQRLIDAVKRTYERGGKVIIPAFSVGRTQTLVYFLHQAMISEELERRPVYVDSPLSVNATEVFRMHPECYDAEARAMHKVTGDILGGGCCTYIRDVEESKALHFRKEPCVIISASGMCEAGRIRHHIKNNVTHSRNTILIPGFQAAHTLGRRLVDGAKKINLFHETYDVKAEVIQLSGFSGHADQAEMLDLLRPIAATARKGIYLVHGEPDQAEAFVPKLREIGFGKAVVTQRGQTVDW